MAPFNFRLGKTNCSTHTISELTDELKQLLEDKTLQPRTILSVNAHIYNLAESDRNLRDNLNKARIITADGKSIVWAARLFGIKIKERCNATEAFRAFLRSDKIPLNKAVLIGCSEQEAKSAACHIEEISSHCRIVKAISGFLEEEKYAEIIRELGETDIIFLGMGTPKTEKISALAAKHCPGSVIWGIGGGSIRIFAGTMPEAPGLLRRIGLQWLYRLCHDPLVLWRRYIIGNPMFVLSILKASSRMKL